MDKENDQVVSSEEKESFKKTYVPPAIVYEGKLEIQVGSPLGRDPGAGMFDPANPVLGGKK